MVVGHRYEPWLKKSNTVKLQSKHLFTVRLYKADKVDKAI